MAAEASEQVAQTAVGPRHRPIAEQRLSASVKRRITRRDQRGRPPTRHPPPQQGRTHGGDGQVPRGHGNGPDPAGCAVVALLKIACEAMGPVRGADLMRQAAPEAKIERVRRGACSSLDRPIGHRAEERKGSHLGYRDNSWNAI
jgi:hypothetical protein